MALAGRWNDQRQEALAYLIEENRILRAQLRAAPRPDQRGPASVGEARVPSGPSAVGPALQYGGTSIDARSVSTCSCWASTTPTSSLVIRNGTRGCRRLDPEPTSSGLVARLERTMYQPFIQQFTGNKQPSKCPNLDRDQVPACSMHSDRRWI